MARAVWGMAVVAWFVLSAEAAMAAAGLANGGFEHPDDPENWESELAVHWGRWGQWINRETGWAPRHGGDCVLGYHHWRIEGTDSSGVFQDIPDLRAGKEYTFNVYVSKDDNTNLESIELRIEPHEGGDTLGSYMYGIRDVRKGKWRLLTVSGTSGGTGLRVLIIVTPKARGERKGALKFDDAFLQCD